MQVGSTDTIMEILDRGAQVCFLPYSAVAEAIATATPYHIKIQGLCSKRMMLRVRQLFHQSPTRTQLCCHLSHRNDKTNPVYRGWERDDHGQGRHSQQSQTRFRGFHLNRLRSLLMDPPREKACRFRLETNTRG